MRPLLRLFGILGLASLGLGLTCGPSQAGGIAAAAGDQGTSLAQLTKTAEGGDVESMRNLALMYAKGDGVAVDLLAARHWAKAAADLNDPLGEWIYYYTISQGPELSFQGPDGSANIDLYNKLAKRSVEERALDISAYSALAKALASGLPQARDSAVHELLDRAAPGNRKAALQLIQAAPPQADHDSLVQLLAQQKQLGETLTKPAMFSDVLQSAETVAMAEAKAPQGTAETLVKMVISKPLSQDTYLPVPEAPFQRFYMLQGDLAGDLDL